MGDQNAKDACPTREQLHKMRYYIQSSSTRSSESSLSEFDDNKNVNHSRTDHSLMIRNMEVINQNINKKLEKKKKDKRSKRDQSSKLRTNGEVEGRTDLGETSLYSACILAANCLSNASHILQEVSGETSAEVSNGAAKSEMSCLMSNLYHLDRTLNLLSQNIKRKKQNGNE